ncbi:hypothetical protein CISG_04083 [Coccidioides immitis RMSCC 3703]|uniref:Zn(2)-C6 fungal-type domain-containing protein n=2 Tax=Coccidioides immitis TaxID=5501 RepID=A0A0J8QSC8_COCIT|nr:hypothetical protein CIRG_08681 [Coccidioides immitis RMSCC 2394]KMU74153.1 hypothetical protein CISG_04083 [Coccidioides immitis RMSCC 3703]
MDGIRMAARPAATPAPDLTANPPFSPHRSPSPPPQHRRGYQACDPCRKRKVKCDLGSVDNPRPPPCVRCRRESKRCEFSATRRKRKVSDDDDKSNVLRRDKRMMSADGALPPDDATNNTKVNGVTSHLRGAVPPPPYEPDVRPSGQRQWGDSPSAHAHRISLPSSQPYPAPTSVPSDQYHHPLPRSSSFSGHVRPILTGVLDSGQHVMNKTAAELLSPAISNTHDALHLLSEAAGRTEDLNRQHMEYGYGVRHSSTSTFNSSASPMNQAGTPGGKASRSNSSTQQGAPMGWYQQNKDSNTTDPLVEGHEVVIPSPPRPLEDVEYANARRAWSRLRFVRAGWFSVDEAMAYIAYYYEHLAPLSPIVIQNFSSPATHVTLLTEEPVLTVTMLTIASRHMKLSGNGANSRAYSIHEKLWSYLRGMIERLIWGQEKFGSSGLPSAKPRQFNLSTSFFGQQSKLNGNLRSLGTVEALLLLTDWHPRALHFPPGDDENTLLDTDPQLLTQVSGAKEEEGYSENKDHGSSSEGRLAFYKWLEPVWRSDRMSWMLLSTAQALAFELGVFDQKNELKGGNECSAEHVRKRRVRRLILVYVSQSSGRLGIPSMLPLPQWSLSTEPVCADNSNSREAKEEFSVDLMQDCWLDISKIMYNSNQVLFPSKEYTTNLIKTGQYRDRIAEFIPSLREFKQKCDRLPMSQDMRLILTIEYEYTRLYVNCLALQAVVDRWTTMSNEGSSNMGQTQSSGAATGQNSNSGTVPLRVLMDQYEVNEPYIQEVVDASRKILQTVLEGLVPGDRLKHAPVRTFFRILSGMIFILKTFTLGAKEDDVRISLELQDRTIESLRTCIVDDVHLSVTIADLLQLLTSNIRTRFLRFAPFDRVDCSSRERTPLPASRQQSPQARDSQSDIRWQTNPLGQGTGNFQFDNSNHSSSAPSTTNDPLASIPAQPINSSNINVSFMPPPPSVYYNYYDHSTSPKMEVDDPTIAPQSISTSGPGSNSNTMSDWFALPLDQFFNSSTAGVDQGLGGTGPMVGEFDMLEVLLKDQYTDSGAGGGGGGGAGGGGGGAGNSGSGGAGGSNGAGLSSQFL